ncbi:MAG: PrsW family intramembrane metalloprotease [Gammaproteobacteria bacterium]|nr:PrsW family intramembrane metalloprotease [Gammaproteobacteria bacterium]
MSDNDTSKDALRDSSDESNISKASYFLTSKLGLEKIEPFSLSSFFSEVFKKHPKGEIENLFTVGSEITTPKLTAHMSVMPNPWIFFRIFMGAFLIYFIFLLSWKEYRNINVVPGLIITGSFAVPLAVLILFYELNTPRNVSIVRLIQLVFFGGTLSILLSLLLFDVTPLLGVFGASAAGFVEEAGKLAAVIIVLNYASADRYRYRLNALLFGAAVGAGFAAFESAGYALRIGLKDADAMLDNITLRGAMSPFAHVAWTAIAASAFWISRKKHKSIPDTLFSRDFLILFSAPVALHFVWNLPFTGIFLLKFWVLGAIAWVIIFSLIQSGLKEIAAMSDDSDTKLKEDTT